MAKKDPIKCWQRTGGSSGTYLTCAESAKPGAKQLRGGKKPEPAKKKREKKILVTNGLPIAKPTEGKRAPRGGLLIQDKSSVAESMGSTRPNRVSQATKLTGLSADQMNALDPAELFGMLPTALGKMVLTPSTTGVKVAAPPKEFSFDEKETASYLRRGINQMYDFQKAVDDIIAKITTRRDALVARAPRKSELDEAFRKQDIRKITENIPIYKKMSKELDLYTKTMVSDISKITDSAAYKRRRAESQRNPDFDEFALTNGGLPYLYAREYGGSSSYDGFALRHWNITPSRGGSPNPAALEKLLSGDLPRESKPGSRQPGGYTVYLLSGKDVQNDFKVFMSDNK